MSDSLKLQRDRFVAFSFASADLFVEVSLEGRITFSIGAARGITGVDETTLMGLNWLELFSPYEQATVQHAIENAKTGLRIGPFVLKLSSKMSGRKAIVTAIKMPDRPGFYLTFGFSNAVIEDVAEKTKEQDLSRVLDRGTFVERAQRLIRLMSDEGEKVFVTFVDILSPERWAADLGELSIANLIEAVEGILISHSLNGTTAGRLGSYHYAVLHNSKVSEDSIKKSIKDVFHSMGVQLMDFPCVMLNCTVKTQKKESVIQALKQVINDFKISKAFAYQNLDEALNAYMNNRISRIQTFESYIKRVSFSFEFQPIVDLTRKEAHHFEILCRFDDGRPTSDWLDFAEAEGLIVSFDLAQVERTINLIKFKDGNTRTRFSMNISPQAVDDPVFTEKLLEQLVKVKDIGPRLLFEFCRVHEIKNKVSFYQLLSQLRGFDFGVVLDDVIPGSEEAKTLINLDAMYIKMAAYHADSLLVEALAECDKQDKNLIIKEIESAERLQAIKNLGILYGQGFYFGQPTAKAVFYGS